LFVQSFELGPVQKPMRVKGVVDAAAPAARLIRHAELEAQLRAARTDVFAVRMRLCRRDPVFFGNVLSNFLALGRHLGVELERLEMKLGGNVSADARQGLIERFQADRAPGAGDVGNKVDFEWSGHGVLSQFSSVTAKLVIVHQIFKGCPPEPWRTAVAGARRCRHASMSMALKKTGIPSR